MFTIEIVPNWHPLVIHFTIALLLVAAALFVAGAAVGARHPSGRILTATARLNLGLGVAAALVSLATGWQAYNSVAHDDAGHANMTLHMYWALGTAAVFAAAAATAWLDRHRVAGASAALLVFLVAGSGALAVTGWLGGENVYRYGLGVMRLPDMEGHQHAPGEAGGGGEMADHGHGSPASERTSPGAGDHRHDEGQGHPHGAPPEASPR